jgi:hypothetical protein
MRRRPAAREDRAMSAPSFQTIRLAPGAHASPEDGACVIELSSMLAGEPFSDHPRTVCPVIAGFLRVYNDRLLARELDELYPLAAMVVGSATGMRARRRRVRRLAAWVHEQDAGRRPTLYPFRDEVVVAAGHAAVRLPDDRRAAVVRALVAELIAIAPERAGAARSAAPAAVPAGAVEARDRLELTSSG